MRCWVHPFCYVPPSPKECYLITASGLKCQECPFRITDENKAKEYRIIYERLIIEREKKHYEFLKSKHWKKDVRPKILQYDEYRCLIYGEEVSPKDAHIHHIIDFSGDEDLSPKNLATLCTKCHAKLHPVFPGGMWALGWPDLEKVKIELKNFYEKVREASIKNKGRLKAPLEHIMMHLCLICQHLEECDIGRFTLNDISANMKGFELLTQKRCYIADLREGLKHVIVEGSITDMGAPKIVETKYGLTQLAVATLKDQTGEITLNLWGDQIGKVKAGDRVRIEEGYIVAYEGRLTLNVPKNWGAIIVNPTNTPSTPYWKPSGNWKGKKMIATCSMCGREFTYVYLGGPIKKRCERCCKSREIKKGTTVKTTCLRCGSNFSYEYSKGPLREYCDVCRKIAAKKSNKEEILKQQVKEMYLKGIRPYKIAENLGIKRNTLNYWLNNLFPDREKWKRSNSLSRRINKINEIEAT